MGPKSKARACSSKSWGTSIFGSRGRLYHDFRAPTRSSSDITGAESAGGWEYYFRDVSEASTTFHFRF
jgi:hypothetical protein